LSTEEIATYRHSVQVGDRRNIPGAVRASAGINTSLDDIARFLAALGDLAGGAPAPVEYVQDPETGDFWPQGGAAGWTAPDRTVGASCARG